MKKDIYIIKNDVNDMVYVGQAKNSEQRFQGHCYVSSMKQYIDKEIKRIGQEHFWYEILESQIENYNEREQYWINYYNSYKNGYNRTIGGDSFENGVNNPASFIKDENILNQIINDLKNTTLQYKDIANKYNIPNEEMICRINTGACYKKDDINYPIKSERVDVLINEQQVKEIKNLLRTSCLSFSEIAKKYNISNSYLKAINVGKLKIDVNENYPIRKGIIRKDSLTDEELEEICDLLINTKLSLRKIAEKFNRGVDMIRGIKNGTIKAYRKEKYTYPLRPNNFKKPVSTISAKESTTTIDT